MPTPAPTVPVYYGRTWLNWGFPGPQHLIDPTDDTLSNAVARCGEVCASRTSTQPINSRLCRACLAASPKEEVQ